MELHQILSVKHSADVGVFVASVEITDSLGETYINDYVSRPDDTFGLAPQVRTAINQWIAEGKPVAAYVPPTPEELRASMPPLTTRQLRLGLVAAGILPSQVDAAIAAIPDDADRAVAEIEWEYATQFERDHPLIEQVGITLGLTTAQIDAMWQAALAL